MKATPAATARLLMPLLGAALLFAAPATAQTRNMLKGLEGLTSEDIVMMRHQAREGLTGKEAGTVLTWRNDASGNSGDVKLEERFERDGNECRRISHGLMFKDGVRRTVKTVICRAGDGWAIVG